MNDQSSNAFLSQFNTRTFLKRSRTFYKTLGTQNPFFAGYTQRRRAAEMLVYGWIEEAKKEKGDGNVNNIIVDHS